MTAKHRQAVLGMCVPSEGRPDCDNSARMLGRVSPHAALGDRGGDDAKDEDFWNKHVLFFPRAFPHALPVIATRPGSSQEAPASLWPDSD